MTFGMVANRILSGLAEEPIKPSHSSVSTKVTRILLLFPATSLQRSIIGLMWPRPGYGMATTWQESIGFMSTVPISNQSKERNRLMQNETGEEKSSEYRKRLSPINMCVSGLLSVYQVSR